MKNYCGGLLLLTAAALAHFSCNNLSLAGGSSSTDNGKVIGMICRANGLPAAHTQVTLLPTGSDPYRDTGVSRIDTTSDDGNYVFGNLPPGRYTLEAVALDNRTRALVDSVTVDSATVYAPVAPLAGPGSITVKVPGTTACYVYVPGTTFFGMVHNGSGTIDSVPAGVVSSVRYAEIADPGNNHVVKTNISVASDAVKVIVDYSSWRYSKKIFLNTTMSGADVSGSVFNFPVLVRLSNANFQFGQAKADGSDLRFKKSDDTPLAFEIERWDVSAQRAEIWVKIDTVYGNDSTHFITQYWGNSTATSESNSAAVFDTSTGFQGVWHMAGEGTSSAYDATENQFNGTPFNTSAASGVEGVIGGARSFDGSSSYITMTNTATGNLNFAQNGSYALSLWVYADTIDSIWHAIAGKGHEQYYLQFKCFGKNRATWEFVEFHNQLGWEYNEDSTPPAPGQRQWLYLVGVRSGTSQRLYINGAPVVDTAALMPGVYARNTGDDFSIGRYGRSVTIPYYQGWSYFKGMVDEVRVSSVVPTADWIRLCYMNQKADDALVDFR